MALSTLRMQQIQRNRGRIQRGHTPQTHDRLKKSCENSCRHDSVFRRGQWLNCHIFTTREDNVRCPLLFCRNFSAFDWATVSLECQTGQAYWSRYSNWQTNAPKYAFRYPKTKNFSGAGQGRSLPSSRSLPNGEGDTPSPRPNPITLGSILAHSALARLGPPKPKSWICPWRQEFALYFRARGVS